MVILGKPVEYSKGKKIFLQTAHPQKEILSTLVTVAKTRIPGSVIRNHELLTSSDWQWVCLCLLNFYDAHLLVWQNGDQPQSS